MNVFNCRSDGEFTFGKWQQKILFGGVSVMQRVGAANVEELANLRERLRKIE